VKIRVISSAGRRDGFSAFSRWVEIKQTRFFVPDAGNDTIDNLLPLPLWEGIKGRGMSPNFRIFVCAGFSLLMLAVGLDVRAGQHRAGGSEGIRMDGHVDFLNSEGRVLASIAVEIADTELARRQGLMWRTGLDDTMGMLFIYTDTYERGFWMHNTPTPLDIIFVSEKRRIIHIAADAVPLSDTMLFSGGPAKYVVEVPAGFCRRYGIAEGAVINWQKTRN
jgi:uncharacterized membrane protein (UPF0127 family)